MNMPDVIIATLDEKMTGMTDTEKFDYIEVIEAYIKDVLKVTDSTQFQNLTDFREWLNEVLEKVLIK